MKKLLFIIPAVIALSCGDRRGDNSAKDRYNDNINQSDTRADESSENDDDEMISTDTTSTEMDTTSMRDN